MTHCQSKIQHISNESAMFILIFIKACTSSSLRYQIPWNVIAGDNKLIKVIIHVTYGLNLWQNMAYLKYILKWLIISRRYNIWYSIIVLTLETICGLRYQRNKIEMCKIFIRSHGEKYKSKRERNNADIWNFIVFRRW